MTAVDQVVRDNADTLRQLTWAARVDLVARQEAARMVHPCSMPGDDTDPTVPMPWLTVPQGGRA